MSVLNYVFLVYLASFGSASLLPNQAEAKRCIELNPSQIYNPASNDCVADCEALDLIEDTELNYCLTKDQSLALNYDECIDEFTRLEEPVATTCSVRELSQLSEPGCLIQCPAHHFPDLSVAGESYCRPCTTLNPSCSECSEGAFGWRVCEKCNCGSITLDKQCEQCDDIYLASLHKSCQKQCDLSCYQCSVDYLCSTCISGFDLRDDQTCALSTTPNDFCPLQCSECYDSVCFSCADGYFGYTDENKEYHCVTECPPGTYEETRNNQ